MDVLFAVISSGTAFGILGYFISYYLEKRKEILSDINNQKRVNYRKFVDFVIDIFAGEKISDKTEIERNKENLTKIYDFYRDFLLYASPKVIQAMGQFMQFIFSGRSGEHPYQMMLLLAEIIKQMRLELGLKNDGLGENGEEIFRPLLKDFEELKSLNN